MKRLLIGLSVLLLTCNAFGTVSVPESKETFFETVARYPYAVVHYINYDQVGDDKVKQAALASMKHAFRSSADESAHVLAGIRFVGLNSKTTPGLMSIYNLQDDFSTVLLFENGEALKDKDGNVIKLTQAFDQNELGVFIQKYFGDFISRAVQEAQARRAAEPTQVRTVYRERPVYRRTSYPRYYGGYGYPYRRYWGYGPRFGFGFGFGGGRRRRRGGFYVGF